MSDEEQPHLPADEEEDDANLEFKPVVKYTALGLAVCAFVGLTWATFRLGVSQGFTEGVASQQVAERLNAAAAQQLAQLLQCGSADDAELQAMAAEADARLAWIRDEQIRREALWQLAQTLLERRMGDQAAPLLQKLFDGAPQEALWTRRMMAVGDAYFAARDPKTAADWYRRAADTSQGGVKPDALAKLFAAQSLRGIGSAELLKEVEALGPDSRPLQMVILTHLGELARTRGAAGEARACFEKAVKAAGDPAAMSADELIYYATALTELGKAADGLRYLNEGLNRLGHEPEMLGARLIGLRQAAAATMSVHNDVNAALALLNRAEGAAEGVLPASDSFWSCLAEQRGWLLLLLQEHEAALAEFQRALENPCDAQLTAQALEGAARCQLVLNRAKEAEELLKRCLTLREKQAGGDAAAPGRVLLLMAQAEDQQGRMNDSVTTYQRAAEALQKAGDTENLITALFGRGYALVKFAKWPEAMEVWQQVDPLVKDKNDRREEARRMLNLCRAHNHLPAKLQDPADSAETAEAAAIEAAAEAEEVDDEEAAAQTP